MTLSSHTATLTCTGLVCTAEATAPFRGVLIHAPDATMVPDNTLQTTNKGCVTHKNRNTKTAVTVTASNPSSISAILVFQSPNAVHEYAVATSSIVSVDHTVYVVGAGPGGLAAAKYAKSKSANVVVLERGPTVPAGFFNTPILNTAWPTGLKYPLTYKPWDNFGYSVGTGVGGTQNINGAVFKPGTATDLAASVGVPRAAAAFAAATAATYIEHTDYDMSWACLDSADCDHVSLATCNLKMARRSLAYDSDHLDVRTSVEVKTVTKDAIVLKNNTKIALGRSDTVVVAAGALASPVLLGNNSFQGWNHYYKTEPVPKTKLQPSDLFRYESGGKVEINTGACAIHPQLAGLDLQITMLMTHTITETHTVGTAYALPQAAQDLEYTDQAWHFAGTVDHNKMQVHPRIFIGDASALKTPFNCHTGMPAAAAGVLAAQRALGVTFVDTPHNSRFAVDFVWLFIVGSALLAVGVLMHTAPQLRAAHYVLMPIGGTLVIAAAIWASTARRGLQPSSHGVLGWTIVALIAANAAAGVTAKFAKRANVLHRILGLVTLEALFAMHLTVLLAKARVESWKDGTAMWTATAVSATLLQVAAIVSARTTEPDKPTDGMNLLL